MMTVAFILGWVACTVIGLYLLKLGKARKTAMKRWKVEQTTTTGIVDGREIKCLRLQARKNRWTVLGVDPPSGGHCLDPSRDGFDERLTDYRVKAKEVVRTLNVNDRLLES